MIGYTAACNVQGPLAASCSCHLNRHYDISKAAGFTPTPTNRTVGKERDGPNLTFEAAQVLLLRILAAARVLVLARVTPGRAANTRSRSIILSSFSYHIIVPTPFRLVRVVRNVKKGKGFARIPPASENVRKVFLVTFLEHVTLFLLGQ